MSCLKLCLPGDATVLASLSLGLAAATPPIAPCGTAGLFLGGDVPLGPAIGTRYVVVDVPTPIARDDPSCISLDVFALNCFRTCAL